MPSKIKTKRKTKRKRASGGKHGQHLNTKLCKEIIDQVVEIVEKGNFRTHAFARININYHTWWNWITRGKQEIKEFNDGKRPIEKLTLKSELVMRLEKAEAEVAMEMNQDIRSARESDGRPDIKARTWFLERRFSKLYARNPNATVQGEESEPESQARGRDVLLGQILKALGRKMEGDGD
jgi:hypothetical protein